MAKATKDKKTTSPKKAAKKPAKTSPAPDTSNAQDAQQDLQQPILQILAQYTKDASFENPNAPDSLRSDQGAPEINISIEIGRQMLENNVVEVVLMLSAKAQRDGKPVFLCELEYAGLFGFGNVAEDHIQPMIMIECPRLLFPFARQIMAEMTQNGGYPPILLEPPDFAGMFREEMIRRAAQQGENAAIN
ncbi:MAG: protein-export chaperone SecB [Robiginitomaculum sp.]|nr:protein-export chaperone SecB [Robiginitomaculum sp.]